MITVGDIFKTKSTTVLIFNNHQMSSDNIRNFYYLYRSQLPMEKRRILDKMYEGKVKTFKSLLDIVAVYEGIYKEDINES